MTYGFLVGEVVRRITGLLPGEFLQQEITGPLGIDFTIGLPEKEAGRVAELVHPPAAARSEQAAVFAQLEPVALAALTNPLVGAAEANTAAVAGRRDSGRQRPRHRPRGRRALRHLRRARAPGEQPRALARGRRAGP